MNRTELLRRVAAGACLRTARNPWGAALDAAVLHADAAAGETRFIPAWQIRRLLDAGLLRRQPGDTGGDMDYVLTDAGRSMAGGVSARPSQTRARLRQAPEKLREREPPGRTDYGARSQSALPSYSFAFQPIVDARQRKVVSYEALVRGRHGEPASHVLGAVCAASLHRFDDESRAAAMTMAASMKLQGHLHLNCVPRSRVAFEGAMGRSAALASGLGFRAGQVVLEVKGSEILDHPLEFAKTVAALQHMGFKLAISDFPARPAGGRLLDRLRPDIVKLDRNAVHGIDGNESLQRFAGNVVQVCARLGADVVAECVETMEEYRWLRAAGVGLFQGHLFARPAFEQLPSASLP